MKNKQTIIFFAVIFIFLIVAAAGTWHRSQNVGKLVFADNLEQVIAKVDETPVTLKDFAIYAVNEEKLVEEQAKVYDDTDTGKYWNTHTNGRFLKLAALDAAIDLTIHDTIFYQMAVEEGISLSDDEMEYLANEQLDFWNDLEEEQQEKLSLSKEEVDAFMEKMALAQKMQRQQAVSEGKDESAYDVGGEEYEKILSKHQVWKDEKIIDRIDFGNIVMEH